MAYAHLSRSLWPRFAVRYVPDDVEALVGPQTEYPVPVPLETVCKWYWRVKRWKITVAGSAVQSAPGGEDEYPYCDEGFSQTETVNFSAAYPNSVLNNAPLADESWLCSIGNYFYEGTGASLNQVITRSGWFCGPAFEEELEYRGVFRIFYATGSYTRSLLYWRGQYYPAIRYFGDEGGGADTFQETPIGPGQTRINSLTLDGIDIPVYSTFAAMLEAPSYTATISTSTVIEPVEYWPYDPGDGEGPCYDATTGAILRDVWSIPRR